MTNILVSETIAAEEDSGVMWPAIIGGTIAASAFVLLLAPLGAALGYAGAPGPDHDWDSAEKTFTVLSAIWLIIVQWLSSGVGGYLTGRLRTAWPGAHTHEVFFRDTAHGFLTWALATVIGGLLLIGGLTHAAHHMPPAHEPQNYAANKLFRIAQGSPSLAVTEQDRADSAAILSEAARGKGVSEGDKAYLTQLVATRTNMSPAVAQARVESAIAQAEETGKTARHTMTEAGIFIFVSMWIGAFIAAAAGALGGMHRDSHYRTGRLS